MQKREIRLEVRKNDREPWRVLKRREIGREGTEEHLREEFETEKVRWSFNGPSPTDEYRVVRS